MVTFAIISTGRGDVKMSNLFMRMMREAKVKNGPAGYKYYSIGKYQQISNVTAIIKCSPAKKCCPPLATCTRTESDCKNYMEEYHFGCNIEQCHTSI